MYELFIYHLRLVWLLLVEQVIICGAVKSLLVDGILIYRNIRLDKLKSRRSCHLAHVHVRIVLALILFSHLSVVILLSTNTFVIVTTQMTAYVMDSVFLLGRWLILLVH